MQTKTIEKDESFKIHIAHQNSIQLQENTKLIESTCKMWLETLFGDVQTSIVNIPLLRDNKFDFHQSYTVLESKMHIESNLEVNKILKNLNWLYSSNEVHVPLQVYMRGQLIHEFRNKQTFNLTANQSELLKVSS